MYFQDSRFLVRKIIRGTVDIDFQSLAFRGFAYQKQPANQHGI